MGVRKMEQSHEKAAGYAAVLLTALLWSFTGLLVKRVPWQALSINFVRCACAFLLRIGLRRGAPLRLCAPTLLGAVCFCATTMLSVLATKHTTAGNASLLQYTSPLFLMLFAWLHGHKRPALRDLTAAAAIFAGVGICCSGSLGGGGGLGNCFALLSGFCFSLLLYLNALPSAQPDDAMVLGFLLSAALSLPAFLHERQYSASIVLDLAVLGILTSGVSYLLLEYGVRRISALNAVFLTALEPVLTPVWVALFYGETLPPASAVGGVLVLGASLYRGLLDARRVTKR